MLQGTNIGRHFFLERPCWNPCSSAYREKKKENTGPPPPQSLDRPTPPSLPGLARLSHPKKESPAREMLHQISLLCWASSVELLSLGVDHDGASNPDSFLTLPPAADCADFDGHRQGRSTMDLTMTLFFLLPPSCSCFFAPGVSVYPPP